MNFCKYIAATIVMGGAALGFTACDSKEDAPYTPADAVTGERVYFQAQTYSAEVGDTETHYTISLFRPEQTAAAETSVQLLTTVPDEFRSLFHVPDAVVFAPGQVQAPIEITFDAATLPTGTTMPVTITVDDAQANLYGITTTTVNFVHASWTEWAEFGRGYYVFSQYYNGTQENVIVLERHLSNDPDQVQYQFTWPDDDDDLSAGYSTFLTAYSEDGGHTITVPEQAFATNSTYGTVYISSVYEYAGEPNDGASGFNSVTGLFTLNVIAYVSEGYFGMGDEYCQLEGYADTNVYEVTLQDLGQVKVEGADYSVVSVFLNENVDQVLYTVASGELDAEQTEEIVATLSDPEQNEITDVYSLTQSGNVVIRPDQSGTYTMVAVGFHEGAAGAEAKCSASLQFTYTTFDPNKGWTVTNPQALWTEPFLSDIFGLPQMELPVVLQQNDENPGLLRIVNPYAALDGLVNGITVLTDKDYYIYLNADDPSRVWIDESEVGLNVGGYGDTYFWSMAGYYNATQDVPFDQMPQQFFGTITDGVLTFDPGEYNAEGDYYEGNQLWALSGYQGGNWLPGLPFFALDLTATSAAAKAKAPARQGLHTAVTTLGHQAKTLKQTRARKAHFTAKAQAAGRTSAPTHLHR